jgi:hypothetical protein
MAVALHVAADDGPVEDVERSEQVATWAEAVPPVAAITATWRRTLGFAKRPGGPPRFRWPRDRGQ